MALNSMFDYLQDERTRPLEYRGVSPGFPEFAYISHAGLERDTVNLLFSSVYRVPK